MENAVLTPFGKAVKKRLVDIERSQVWLIEQVAGTTGLCFDRLYVYKQVSRQPPKSSKHPGDS